MMNGTTTYEYSLTERNILLDEFLTPIELIEACFKHAIVPAVPGISKTILDVGANDGRWGKVARKYFTNAKIYGVEIMDMPDFPAAYDGWFNDDFITIPTFMPDWGEHLNKFDLIIGNPPFTVKEPNGFDENGKQLYKIVYKAEDFVRKALSLLTEDGSLAFLLRSNFRHAQERIDLFRSYCPFNVYDCMLRPSFYKEDTRTEQYNTKQTNAHDYALFVWSKRWHENYYLGRQLVWNYKD